MASIAQLTETFEGSAGTNISTSNTGADSITGGATIKFNADGAVGSTSAEIVATANYGLMRFDHTRKTTVYFDFILKMTALDTGSNGVAVWYDSAGTGTGKIGDLQVNYVDATHYTLRLRDNSTTKWTSASLSTSTWYRIQIKVIPGSSTGHRVWIYNTITSDTADQDSGNLTATGNSQTAMDNLRLGCPSSSTMTVRLDDLKADDALQITRASGVSASAAIAMVMTISASGGVDTGTTDALQVKVGGSWVPAVEKTRVAGTWV